MCDQIAELLDEASTALSWLDSRALHDLLARAEQTVASCHLLTAADAASLRGRRDRLAHLLSETQAALGLADRDQLEGSSHAWVR